MAELEISGAAPVDAAPAAGPRWPWVVFYGVFGAALIAYGWAMETPAKPLATVLTQQARGIGVLALLCALASALANWRKTFQGLRLPLLLIPLYVAGLVPGIVAATAAWCGGWVLGIAGAAAGAAAGALTGWLFTRWMAAEIQTPKVVASGTITMVGALTVLLALYGGYTWATMWPSTLGEAWMVGLFPMVFALLGALVRRPILGLVSALPLVPLPLVPLIASMTVGWGGDWLLGIAGAAAGSAAGAATGLLYQRWIMPEYEKRRVRESAVWPPGSPI